MSAAPRMTIESFCRTGSGGTPCRKRAAEYYGGTIPWVKSGELRETLVTDTSERITEQALRESSVKPIPAGAILVAMYGATVGRMALLGVNATSNQAICHIIPDPATANPDYVYYALRAHVPKWLGQAVGGAQPNISQKVIKGTRVRLPPLPEQRRIAAILDKADAIRRKRRQAIELTEELLRSAFLEMFGDPVTNPKGWPVVELGDLLATPPRIGTTKPATADGEHPVVRVGEIGARRVALDRCGRVTLSDVQLERYRCQPGDFLLARAIGSASHLGKASIVQEHDGVVVFDSHVMRLRFDPKRTSPYWFSQWMRTRGGRALFMRQAGRTAVQFNVNAKQIARVRVPVPDRELQERFLDVAGAARGVQARERGAAEEADDLFHSLAQRAFRGEL